MSNNNSGKAEELYAGLDKVSEYNKLGGRGHGGLADTCYICGISPSKLKIYIEQAISSKVNEARIDENHFHLSNLSHGDARSYSVQKIRDRIRTLKESDE